MKAKLLFTIILTFLSVSFSKAQSWVQNDAVWHYDYYMTGYGFYKVSLGNDTIIAGRTCQRYITEKHQFFPQPGNVFVAGPVVDYPQRFTSVSGDTVFHYENDTFYTLFNRSEEHTSELQSRPHLVCRLLLEKKKKQK